MIKIEGTARRQMVLFFIVDTSGSMDGVKIQTVNNAIGEVLPKIREISDGNADGEIRIAALGFDNAAYWQTEMPQKVESFVWSDLSANGGTNLADALHKLNEKLTRKEGGFMVAAAGSFAPVLFLMSDGQPNDSSWERELEKLKENKWYKVAIKVALAIGSDADKDVLSKFTGTNETVLGVYTPEMLATAIKFVTVSTSQVGTSSTNPGSNNKPADTVESKQEQFINTLKADMPAELSNASSSLDDEGW